MQILATGIEARRQERGFTLIELMVVIAILGLASAAVIFVLPDPRGGLIAEAERFAARAVHVRDEAVLSARATRVDVSGSGYRFAKRERGEWAPYTAKPLMAQEWREGTSAAAAAIEFDSNGFAIESQTVRMSRDGVNVAIDFSVGGGINVVR